MKLKVKATIKLVKAYWDAGSPCDLCCFDIDDCPGVEYCGRDKFFVITKYRVKKKKG